MHQKGTLSSLSYTNWLRPRINNYNFTSILTSYTYIFFRSLADGVANGQRSAGDVLNDIGSMLSDLTDELDAMLHMERDPLKN